MKIIDDIKENAISYGGIPFWSWNDDLSDTNTLKRQINDMHKNKMNGFFMHARGGLETEYLSSKWFKAVKICVEEAKKLGMQAWAYDENGWPSGFAGGKLLSNPENHARYIEHKFFDEFPTNEDALAIYAIIGKNHPIKTETPIKNAEKYLVIYERTDSSYVDTLRADITDKFIKETHKLYKQKLGDDFGKSMPGFFTDEPQYYRYANPYSKMLDVWFNEEYGYSVFEALPAVFTDFDGYEKYLYDYHKMLHTKFTNNFIKRIYDWARENGVKITGHATGENSLSEQMLANGGVMPFYEYEDIPGIDYLCRKIDKQILPKQLGSVCEQLGKKKALTETFASCGWDVTPKELKGIAEFQYAGGANVMCQHLYPISERGQRKRDYPAHFSEHNAWFDKLGKFNEYFNNLGYTLSLGKQDTSILVIHPMHSAYLTYRRQLNETSVYELDKNFAELTAELSSHQIPFHFGDECIMAKHAYVDGSTLCVGNCRYDTVIIPKLDTLDNTTVNLLTSFSENGGKTYSFKSHLPTRIDGRVADYSEYGFIKKSKNLDFASVFKELCNKAPYSVKRNGKNIPQLLASSRKTEQYGDIFYITNYTADEIKNVVLTIRKEKQLCSLDMLTLETKPVCGRYTNGKTEILLDFPPYSSYVLTEGDIPFLPFEKSKSTRKIKFNTNFTLEKKPENILTLDRASLSYDGKEFTEERPIERIRDNLLYERYSGNVWLKFAFETEFIPSKIDFVCEKPSVTEIKVNGTPLKLGRGTWFDSYFKRTNIAKHVKIGKNEIILKINYYQNDYVYKVLYGNVMESLRNCLNFDTEIEATYLVGNFAIKTETDKFTKEPPAERYSGSFTLTKQKRKINVQNLVKDGYPFFSGTMAFSKKINYKEGSPTVLKLTGRYHICEVLVNERPAGEFMFNDEIDLKDYLNVGKNKLTLKLTTNRRNTLGPHHASNPEPSWVSPITVSFEGMWQGDKCDNFVKNYSFIRFGID